MLDFILVKTQNRFTSFNFGLFQQFVKPCERLKLLKIVIVFRLKVCENMIYLHCFNRYFQEELK